MTTQPPYATSSFQNGVLVVTILASQVRDAVVAYALRDEMTALVDRDRPQHLVIDLAGVQFIGSIGFLAFLGVRRRLEAGRVVLCHLSPALHDTFAICRLIPTEPDGVAPFEVAADVDEALLSLRV